MPQGLTVRKYNLRSSHTLPRTMLPALPNELKDMIFGHIFCEHGSFRPIPDIRVAGIMLTDRQLYQDCKAFLYSRKDIASSSIGQLTRSCYVVLEGSTSYCGTAFATVTKVTIDIAEKDCSSIFGPTTDFLSRLASTLHHFTNIQTIELRIESIRKSDRSDIVRARKYAKKCARIGWYKWPLPLKSLVLSDPAFEDAMIAECAEITVRDQLALVQFEVLKRQRIWLRRVNDRLAEYLTGRSESIFNTS